MSKAIAKECRACGHRWSVPVGSKVAPCPACGSEQTANASGRLERLLPRLSALTIVIALLATAAVVAFVFLLQPVIIPVLTGQTPLFFVVPGEQREVGPGDVVVEWSQMSLRTGPGVAYPVVYDEEQQVVDVFWGTRLLALGTTEDGRWYKVEVPTERGVVEGWLPDSALGDEHGELPIVRSEE